MAVGNVHSVSSLVLPDEIILPIFSCLSRADLGRCARVCQQWNRVAQDKTLWKSLVLREGLGKRVLEINGRVEDERPFMDGGQELTWKEACRRIKALGPDRTAFYIPKTINGEPTTINRFMALVAQSSKPTQFRYIHPEFLLRYGDVEVKESYWAVATNTVVEGTRENQPQIRIQLISQMGQGQRLPKLVEQIFFVILNHQAGRPCGYGPETFSQCEETIEIDSYKCFLFVGGFVPAAPGSPGGFCVECYDFAVRCTGAAALRKF